MGIRGYTTRGRLCTRFESTPPLLMNDTIPLSKSCIKEGGGSHPKSKFSYAVEKLRRLIGMVLCV